MSLDLKKLLLNLKQNACKDDFIEMCEEAVEHMSSIEETSEVIEPILKLFEEVDDADFGMPGPLVHYLESFYKSGYEEKLFESLNRKPTNHTLWMLNRILNSLDGDEKVEALKFLDDVISSGNADSSVLKEAVHYRSLH